MSHLKQGTQQQQGPESKTVTITWHASKYEVDQIQHGRIFKTRNRECACSEFCFIVLLRSHHAVLWMSFPGKGNKWPNGKDAHDRAKRSFSSASFWAQSPVSNGGCTGPPIIAGMCDVYYVDRPTGSKTGWLSTASIIVFSSQTDDYHQTCTKHTRI